MGLLKRTMYISRDETDALDSPGLLKKAIMISAESEKAAGSASSPNAKKKA
jgi:hypothetical protein